MSRQALYSGSHQAIQIPWLLSVVALSHQFILLLGPFPARTRCYHRSRFHDQNRGYQRAEGQGTWTRPSRGIVWRCAQLLQLLTANVMFFQLQIWDTAGQERFRSITQSYYRSANALILTYDITCEDSFRCLPEWLREIEQYANNQVVTILVGKKLVSAKSFDSTRDVVFAYRMHFQWGGGPKVLEYCGYGDRSAEKNVTGKHLHDFPAVETRATHGVLIAMLALPCSSGWY